MTEKPAAQKNTYIKKLVERLRRNSGWRNEQFQCVTDPALLTEAADTITALRTQCEVMAKALEGAVQSLEWWQRNEPGSFGNIECQRLEAARAALQSYRTIRAEIK